MKHIITIILLCIGIVTNAGAQTFTQRIQQNTAGQGIVTIHQSDSISRLVNSAQLVSEKASPATPPTTAKPAAKPSANAGSTGSTKESAATAPPDTTDLTGKKMMRGGYKVMGYRVQAFAGGNSRKDRQQAEQTGNNIKANFPNVPVYVHFYAPRWICRVGNYRTYEEAHQMLVSLRSLGYTQASIVKGKITVSY